MFERSSISSVLVTVITYKRPAELRRMIESLVALVSQIDHRILVVDNDPAGSAKVVAERFSHEVEYSHEPTPGIAAARNRCLDAARESDDAIVFLDDDEVVTSNLLDELVGCANNYGIDIVGGHVQSILPSDAPKWIKDGNFFQRRIRETGQSDGLPATNNALVRTEFLRSHPDVRFDHDFSVTGGSDSDFFSRLIRAGATFAWCQTALVQEYVQTDRVTLRWLARRYTRGGETSARVLAGVESKPRLIARGISYVIGGVIFSPISLIVRKDLRGRNLILFARGLGLIRGSVGLTIKEYSRRPRPKDASIRNAGA